MVRNHQAVYFIESVLLSPQSPVTNQYNFVSGPEFDESIASPCFGLLLTFSQTARGGKNIQFLK